MDIEKKLFPESGKLKLIDGVYTMFIVDAELDLVEVKFYYDDCAYLVTHEMGSYLTAENLHQLMVGITEAREKYEELYKDEDEGDKN